MNGRLPVPPRIARYAKTFGLYWLVVVLAAGTGLNLMTVTNGETPGVGPYVVMPLFWEVVIPVALAVTAVHYKLTDGGTNSTNSPA